MLRAITLIISVIFQPLLIPSLVFGLILFVVPEASSIPAEFKLQLFYLIALSTLLIPMITIIGFRLSGAVRSLHMEYIKDRIIPFITICIYFLISTYFLYKRSEFDPILWQSLLVISVTIIGLTIVTFFWKMSAHMTGIGGLIAVIVVLAEFFPTFNSIYYLISALILTGAIGSSRLFLNAHSPKEVYSGLIYGFLCCYIGFHFVWT